MIVDLIEHQGLILAVNDLGHLLIWNIARHKLNNQCYQFQHNISIVPPLAIHTVHNKELLGIVSVGSQAAIYNSNHLYALSLANLVSQAQDLQTTNLKEINVSVFLQASEQISFVAAVNDQAIAIATSKGNMLVYNLKEDEVVVKSSLWDQIKPAKETGLLTTAYEPIPQITSIVCLRSGNIGLVSLQNGKIFAVEMNELRALEELTSCLNSQLEKINKLYLNQKEDKVYSLHHNYIVEWNYKLHSCLSYIQYSSPRGMAYQKNSFVFIGMHPALTLIDRQSIGQTDETSNEVQLSMRGALVIKPLGGQLLAVGGTDNLVDIFLNHSRLMTLIHK